jgi:hypothetical protein
VIEKEQRRKKGEEYERKGRNNHFSIDVPFHGIFIEL